MRALAAAARALRVMRRSGDSSAGVAKRSGRDGVRGER
ncbi:hypothetical protein DB31_4201 [Hyalangium minutum]|uniref:Uncharacterized protein n=1 Tax=Hyalangium minutum TaxID=394096 RepID=A0A085W332_9BACT|nr:hypothetical protein DB31_4201 [Hyalangium minutum]